MNQFSYRPGAWRVVVETGGMIAVPQDTDTERVALLHRMLRDGAPELTDVIDALAGGSIADLGSFAVALTSAGSVRFAVRGPVQARIVADDDEQIVSGAQVSTWSERFVADARGFEITVDDEGPGIPPHAIERIFERFYTDRPDHGFGQNSGLGLSISRQIVEAHRGTIRAAKRPPGPKGQPARGARFIVRLPSLKAA